MTNPIEIYYGTRLLFRFNPMPTNLNFHISKIGNSPMDIPTFIRPWMIDFTSQQRSVSVDATILASTYDVNTPGTGAIADQIEDLLYIFSCNWANVGPTGIYPTGESGNYLMLFVPYPTPLTTATHSMASLYPDTGNSDYLLDRNSVPYSGQGGATVPPGSGSPYTRIGADKIYYVYPQDFDYKRDPASVNRVNVSMSFLEVSEVIKI
jgi:hypothetical protein